MTIFVFEEESLDKIENMKEIILSAIDSKNGQDIKVLDVREQTSIADFFIIASGNSSTQVTAIADEIVCTLNPLFFSMKIFPVLSRSSSSSTYKISYCSWCDIPRSTPGIES